MKKLYLAVMGSLLATGIAQGRVIYGKDHRVEYSEATPFHKKFIQAAVSMISVNDMMTDEKRPGVFRLNPTTLRQWLEILLTEGEKSKKKLFTPKQKEANTSGMTFCPDERFVDQPNPSMCSGFLIADDLVVTAGHCAETENFCADFKWVFGFEVNPFNGKTITEIYEDNIYSCKQVVSYGFSLPLKIDYAIVQLDRRVPDRTPVEIRNEGIIEDNNPLFVVGSPSGLPLKVADNANVRENKHPYFFKANLDTFQGNSGSPVFNAKTGVVEGILVRGEEDYVLDQKRMCVTSKECADNSCKGEEITRMTTIPEVLVQKIFNRAAETGDLVTIEKVLKLKIWIDFYGKDRENALIKASKNAQSKVIEMLASRGSDLNFQDNVGYTPLHHLAKTLSVKTEASVIALKNGKADFNLYDFAGDTPVFIAAKALNLEGVKLLLKHGSSYDYTDVDGNSILMPFTRAGNFKAVRELLALGVNPSIENDDGDTIYDLGFPRR